ncbi:glycosyltransferase [Tamlana haliotis]|uniref:Glycosyltransferase n=1 Tax=Pseudotamlana haliotis TaxID=2614804 RepID=A0A6N6M952_9FLAO|nr:glycosyltransferase [Tamlana haliotis]KAB1067027.1 glycosyltransferase [Tamlana haliotis]
MLNPTFSILITTKNRLEDLKQTLRELMVFIDNNEVEFIICDDGSTDGTSNFIATKYKTICLIKNNKSEGLIYSRNKLLALTKAKYAITLDDDAHIVSKNSLEIIETFFKSHPKCAVMALRVFWGKTLPVNLNCNKASLRVQGFVGCGHVWRMEAWRDIPYYPDWFVFYGEEDFASYQLFKKGWNIVYNPNVLVHHRVDVKSRKKQKDYRLRLRRSLRSGWYLYFLFYPINKIPKRLVYTFWQQIKKKTFKGDVKATIAIFQAMGDVVYNFPRLIKYANRLTNGEFKEYQKLPDTKLYWKPLES